MYRVDRVLSQEMSDEAERPLTKPSIWQTMKALLLKLIMLEM